MEKYFNDTGLCVPHRHHMVDSSAKLAQITALVERGHYFTINRPRQYGKTTTLSLLSKQLNQRNDYIALKISFEPIDSETHKISERFIGELVRLLAQRLSVLGLSEMSTWLEKQRPHTTTLPLLSQLISQLVQRVPHTSWVLLIDEVDKSSNYQLFLDLLNVLRHKYLLRDDGETTFHAVVLAGVHDIKTLKRKIRPDAIGSYNSPWNIAVDFNVDLSFSPPEIKTMLQSYATNKQITMPQSAIAQRLHYYTSGYPYLVSKLCKFIDEDILPLRDDQNWYLDDVEAAFKMIADEGYTSTLFDSLGKNLEAHPELYEFIFQITINGEQPTFSIINPVVNLAHLYGIIRRSDSGHCRIHNRIFEQKIYGYMLSKTLQQRYTMFNGLGPEFFTTAGLDVTRILKRFQAFMKEHYSDRDERFLEREGRLLFLAYLAPIVNGKGFAFKEPTVSNERRMDIVITHREDRYVIELKRWYGNQYHQRGLQQLSDYLDSYGLKVGYLLIYDFTKGKQYRQEQITFQDKQIFAVWV